MNRKKVHGGAWIAGVLAGAIGVITACSSSSPTVVQTPVEAGVNCGDGSQVCGTSCTVIARDAENCGACGKKCGAGEVCSAGACAAGCGGGTTKCASSCVDTKSDGANCGACGTACKGGEVCSAGKCAATCGAGTTTCGSSCVNTQTDQVNCGACGTLCQGGEQCVAGKCQLSCQAGLSLCTAAPSDGGVSDASSDVSNDVSVSDAGPVLGSTYCANFQTDNANCGACGVTCGSGQQCVSGACSASCGNGSTLCKPDGGAPYCSVLASDSQNCGSCGNVCGPQQQCVAGTCKTPVLSGTVADVNGVFSNVTFVKCGNGTNTNCTEPVAESSCTAIGRKLVSHASNGTNAVTSLGATNSCQWSISYFTNYDPLVAGQCLVGVSNAQWTTCCNTTQWHGNIVTVPAQTGVQFGFVNSGNTGYNAGLTNTSGTTWGCQTNATAVPVRAGCTNYYVACR